MGQKLGRNRSISYGFRDISIFVFCDFCEKCENSKWPRHLARQNFLKIGMDTLQRFPVAQKLRRNHSI